MTGPSIQDRTGEFNAILGQAQKRMASTKVGAQRQALLSDSQRREANGSAEGVPHGKRSEFARRAAEIGRGITATTAKLQRLAERECLRTVVVVFMIHLTRQSPNEKPSSMIGLSRFPS